MKVKELLRGGQFLVKESPCDSIFTPEDFFRRTANDVDGFKAFYKVQPLPQCSSAQGQHR